MSTHDYRTRDEIIISVKGPAPDEQTEKEKRQKAAVVPPKIDKRFLPRREHVAAGYTWKDIRPSTIGVGSIALGSYYQYFPQSINQNDLIAGYTSRNNRTIAQYWAPGGFESPLGDFDSVGYGLNESGVAVARQPFGPLDNRAYKYNYVAFTLAWLGSPLGFDGRHFTEAYRINNAGVAVGSSDPRFLYPAGNGTFSKAIKWPATATIEIFPGDAAASIAYDINGPGMICGMYDYQPFIWRPSTGIQLLGSLSGEDGTGALTELTALNGAGHGCGNHTIGIDPNNEGFPILAFYFDGTNVFNIDGFDGFTPTPGALPMIGAADINSHNEIVGTVCVGVDVDDNFIYRGYLWNQADGMTLLQDLLPEDSTIVLTNGVGINDAGNILAIGYNPDGTNDVTDNPFIRRGYFGRKG